jgi:hypothetical protein
MGFRSDEEARVRRIDALEGQLSEKDAEIARLRAQLEGPRPTPQVPTASARDTSASTASAPGPGAREVWSFPTHDPKGLWIGMAWVVLASVATAYLGTSSEEASSLAAMAAVFVILSLPALFLFHRHRLTLDPSAGTVTRHDRVLFVTWKRTVSCAGRAVEVDRRLHSPSDGESYWVDHVYLGDLKLFAKRGEEADALAKKVARHLGVPCRPRPFSAEETERRARRPLVYTMIVGLILGLVFVLRQYLSG